MKNELYISGTPNNCPVEWNDDYDAWVIDEIDIIEAITDPDMDDNAEIIKKVIKKIDLGRYALPIAIAALKQVRVNIEFDGYYEHDILKLAEKILKDEYKFNRYNYE